MFIFSLSMYLNIIWHYGVFTYFFKISICDFRRGKITFNLISIKRRHFIILNMSVNYLLIIRKIFKLINYWVITVFAIQYNWLCKLSMRSSMQPISKLSFHFSVYLECTKYLYSLYRLYHQKNWYSIKLLFTFVIL